MSTNASTDAWSVTVDRLPGWLWGVNKKGKRVRYTVLSLNSRPHWRQRSECMRLDKQRVFYAARKMPLTMPWDRVVLRIDLYGMKRHHSKDWEQTVARCKGYIDGLKDCGAITDDTMKNIIELHTEWHVAPEEEERTVMEVTKYG